MISSPFTYFFVFDFFVSAFFFFFNFWLESSPIHEAILKRQCFITKLGKRCPVSILPLGTCSAFSPGLPCSMARGSQWHLQSRLGRPPVQPHSLCLGGGGGGGSRPAGRSHREQRVLHGLCGCGAGVKAGHRPRAPRGGRDQADRVAGEQREVLRVQEQRGSHDVGGSSRIGKYQVPSCIQ